MEWRICLDSMLLAEQELRSGRLVVLFPETAMSVRGHGFVTLRSKADTPRSGISGHGSSRSWSRRK